MSDTDLEALVREHVRALRAERGLTQEQLCERAHISLDAVSRIENGSRVPTLDTLQRLATALGVPVAALVQEARAPKKTESPAAVRRVVALLEQASPAVQESAEELVRVLLRAVRRPTKPRRPASR